MPLNLVFATNFGAGSIEMFPAAQQSAGGVSIETSIVHTTPYALKLEPAAPGDRAWVEWALGAGVSTVYVAAWVYPAALLTNSARIQAIMTDGKVIDVRLNQKTWDAYVDDVKVASGAINFPSVTAWHHIQVKFVISDSGSIQTKVDNQADISYSGDTKPSVATDIQYIAIYNHDSTAVVRFGDWAIATGDWPGDIRVERKRVVGDTGTRQFSRSAGAVNYGLVDEETPSDADYVYSSTDGHQDLYAVEEFFSGNCEILGVAEWVRAWEETAAGESIRPLLQSGSSLSRGDPQTVTTSAVYYYRLLTTDPATAAAWLKEALGAVQAGQEAEV